MEQAPGHPFDSFSWKKSPLVLLVVVAAVGIRAWLALSWEIVPSTPREALYTQLADEWRLNLVFQQDGHPTAVVMPVYPVGLGILRWFFPESWKPVLLLQAIAGGIIAWLVHRFAWRVTNREGVAWTTLALCAFYPPLVLSALKLDPGIFLGLILALALWLLSCIFRGLGQLVYFILAAVLFILGIYLSPKILVLAPILALWAGLHTRERMTGLLGAIAFCLACILSLMPWTARNFLTLGGFIPLTTGFAYTLNESLESAMQREFEESEIAVGQDESFQYHARAGAALSKTTQLGKGGWSRIILRSVPFWITSYPGLIPQSEVRDTETTPNDVEQSLPFRALLLTTTVTLAILALAGLGAGFFNPHAWMLVFFLSGATLVDILFDHPAYDHLSYWPYFSIFVAWGCWTGYHLFVGWQRDRPAKAEKPLGVEPAWGPEGRESPPIAPLEPIRTRRLWGGKRLKDGSGDKDKLGPIF